MDKNQIMGILPHREDMLLIEEAYLKEDGSAEAFYTVSAEERRVGGECRYWPAAHH